MPKKAFITGVTGQDGSYLAEFLIERGYEVHAILRRSSVFTTSRLKQDLLDSKNFYGYHGDLADSSNLHRLIDKIQPNEVYNLGAQSHVKVSFEVPEYTAEVDALGAIRILDSIRDNKIETKFYQASTSELFGGFKETAPQNESTLFQPRSPYAVAKLYAHWISINYRQSYGLFTSNGILFNHESPRRGQTFVTKKITQAVSRIFKKTQDQLIIGNLDAIRDWGYAKDYVEAIWLMLQHDKPDDFVISTGEPHSVREFIEKSFEYVDIKIEWHGEGVKEIGIDSKSGKELVKVSEKYFRPSEVDYLVGDYSKAKKILGWYPKTSFNELIEIMMKYDLNYDEYGFD